MGRLPGMESFAAPQVVWATPLTARHTIMVIAHHHQEVIGTSTPCWTDFAYIPTPIEMTPLLISTMKRLGKFRP
ncbi:hypothetical protein EDD15DRAFT_2248037, partial [Pisolithus albus]